MRIRALNMAHGLGDAYKVEECAFVLFLRQGVDGGA